MAARVVTGSRNALAVREAIEAAHPEITITTPLTSRSGRWELCVGGSNTTYGSFWMMIDHLAAKFGEAEPADAEPGEPREPETNQSAGLDATPRSR